MTDNELYNFGANGMKWRLPKMFTNIMGMEVNHKELKIQNGDGYWF